MGGGARRGETVPERSHAEETSAHMALSSASSSPSAFLICASASDVALAGKTTCAAQRSRNRQYSQL